jgi:mRNA interferase RelE/StbE
LTWTIEYAYPAKQQLRKLDRQVTRRVLDFMDERVAGLEDARGNTEGLGTNQ